MSEVFCGFAQTSLIIGGYYEFIGNFSPVIVIINAVCSVI